VLADGDYILVVNVLIKNSDGRYLITKRAPNKGFPNMWENTGGAAITGDSSLIAALREAKEETGLTLDPKRGVMMFTDSGGGRFADNWLFRCDFTLDNIVLQPGETVDARLVTADEIRELERCGEFVPFHVTRCNELIALADEIPYDTKIVSIGLPEFPVSAEVYRRVSARGVCVRAGKALMIKYAWGGFGFPGGGIEAGETMRDAVAREIREEVGYAVKRVGDLLTCVVDRMEDMDIHGGHVKWFEQPNFFFACEVGDEAFEPDLTPDEQAREYAPVWVDLREALAVNSAIPERERDVAVLRRLLNDSPCT
jgi:8-oxo-dGTP pyrophosphatase MutT (NUDIX family)